MAELKSSQNYTARAYKSRPVSIWHLVAGVIMAALGIYVWFNPVATMVALALYLGIAFIVLGVGYVRHLSVLTLAGICLSACWIF